MVSEIADTLKHLRELAERHFTVLGVDQVENTFTIRFMDKTGYTGSTKPTSTEVRAWWLLCGHIDGIAN